MSTEIAFQLDFILRCAEIFEYHLVHASQPRSAENVVREKRILSEVKLVVHPLFGELDVNFDGIPFILLMCSPFSSCLLISRHSLFCHTWLSIPLLHRLFIALEFFKICVLSIPINLQSRPVLPFIEILGGSFRVPSLIHGGKSAASLNEYIAWCRECSFFKRVPLRH